MYESFIYLETARLR